MSGSCPQCGAAVDSENTSCPVCRKILVKDEEEARRPRQFEETLATTSWKLPLGTTDQATFPADANSAVPMGLNMNILAPSPGNDLPGYFQSPLWG